MKCKRLIALLALCAALAALALPVSAAGSSFSDVRDGDTAVHADVLRLMGVVAGSGGNSFNPGGRLTRAEFCVMAVKIMGKGGDVPAYTTRTIFSDVTARHWARGYVNLAASTTLSAGEKASSRLISGVGNGQFRPDDQITYAQAVTILVRMLGYGDDKVGAVWPAGYLNQAAALGLTDGLGPVPAGNSISRAQAATLFVNLLSAKKEGGQKYYETLGTVSEDVMLLAVDVEMNDKTPGGIRTSQGTYLPAARGVAPTALQGLRGALVLDERKEIAAFVPDGSAGVTVTLSGDAQATYLKGTNGTRYSIPTTTPAFTSKDEATTYAELWMDLRSGNQVTLFMEGGKVVAVYYAAGGRTAEEANVITAAVNSAAFNKLTGGASGWVIKKDGEVIGLSDIKPYDVVTYDPLANTMTVSGLRLTCVYEKATPNTATPQTITVLGHDFPVLDSALDSIGKFRLGDTVSLLLTADGQVAGMAEAGVNTRSTAVGLADSGGVSVELPNGGSIQLQGAVDGQLQNQVVTVTGGKDGKLYASRLSSGSVPGDFDLNAMTLDSYKVAAGVRIYEKVGKGGMVSVKLADLEMGSIKKNQMTAYRLNSSNMVDIIILDAVTGDAYTYGKLKEGEKDTSLGAANSTIVIENSAGTLGGLLNNTPFRDGGFGGVAVGARVVGNIRMPATLDMVQLTAIGGIERSDFFERDDIWYVNANGAVYQVSDKVEGYVKATESWFTQQADRLSAIRAYANDMTIYLDPVGNKVRVIEVK